MAIIVKHSQIDETWEEYASITEAAAALWEDGFHDAIELAGYSVSLCHDRLAAAIREIVRQSAEDAAHERYESAPSNFI